MRIEPDQSEQPLRVTVDPAECCDQDQGTANLPRCRRSDCVYDSLLSPRSGRDHQDRRETVVVSCDAYAGAVALIGGEFGTQGGRTHSTAVELQKEPVVAASQTQQAVAVRSHATVSACRSVAPLHQFSAALAARAASDQC